VLTSAQRELADAHVPLARGLAKRAVKSWHVSFDDAVSDAFYGLTLAARRFDPDRGAAFASFACEHVWGAILHGIRGRAGFRGMRERGEPIPQVGTLEDMHEVIVAPGCANDDVTILNGLRPVDQRMLFAYHVLGLTQTEIASVERVSQMQISRRIRHAEKRLRERLETHACSC
jgi:RNA polymerase sigma factor (sigma-70 family)